VGYPPNLIQQQTQLRFAEANIGLHLLVMVLLFVCHPGYAILNNAEMPIVATDKDKKPNDNFNDHCE
jgi:hypothetical protein